jgi:deoxyribodipyrimidine photolyase-related protein
MSYAQIRKMKAVTLVFPHQLFEVNPAIEKTQTVYLIEELLFFKQYKYHKQKLVFHRASMKAYQHYLQSKGYKVIYIEAHEHNADVRNLLPSLKKSRVSEVHYCEVTDNFLEKRISRNANKLSLEIKKYNSPLFILTQNQIADYFSNKKRFFQTDFYTRQRKHYKILVDENLQPVGGKWTFDAENRLKYPKGRKPPTLNFPATNEYWMEATAYVKTNFSTHYGAISNSFTYPTTFQESLLWLKQFLQHRFSAFGDYEDAMVKNEITLHHSVLSPILNVGLLTPGMIIDQAIAFAKEKEIPLNSCEGFVRQILGWREFIRGVYEAKGTQARTTNFWKFKRKIPPAFWEGTTGITPIDNTIKKILATGYCHHIERLMVLGNFMLLCEFDPNEVYRWFMELFIDAYDWVMVPNVYGMSQFADGGLMATKPYISGSNYLMKMSDFEKGDWQPIWDGLFWRFMHTHRDFFLKNPRLGMLVKTFDKMPAAKQKEHLQRANSFLAGLDNGN